MIQIQPVDPNQAGAASALLSNVKQQLGVVPNIFATMARAPAVLEGFLALNGALGRGQLTAAVREQIALAVAGYNTCDYCASAHTLLAKGAGVAQDEAARNLDGQASDPKVAAVLKFARALTSERGRVSGADLQVLRGQGISDGEIIEIVAAVGINLFTNYFNHVAGTEIDFPKVVARKG
jgi:uncharacterized peroxidase-related enzyme